MDELRKPALLEGAAAHDANQSLHVIRLAAEAMQLDLAEGRVDPARMARRTQAILAQVEALTTLLTGRAAAPLPSPPPPSPLPPSPSPPSPSSTEDTPPDDESDEAGPPLVLLVDDEALSVMMVGEFLQRHGFRVASAYDGEEALALCRTQVFDAVVSDIRMPRMDGLALIAQLAELQPGTPVIVVTGHLNAAKAADIGPNVAEVLAKPFDPKILREKLVRLIPPATESAG